MRREPKLILWSAAWALGVALAACMGADEFNLAPLGTATQSSVGWNGVPERAIDGNTSGIYGENSVTHTATGDPAPWWQVDLGDIYAISRIVIWNRTDDCCPHRLTNFYVSILDEAGTELWGEVYFEDCASYPDTRLEGFEIEISPAIEGMIVRIDFLECIVADRYLSLAEVQVFGSCGGPPRIVEQPVGGRVPLGSAFTLSVHAICGAPLTYKWFKDGKEIPDSNARTLVLDPVRSQDAGAYKVVVSNASGTEESETVEIVVTSKNLARTGTATQSSVGWGGVPSRAIDGNPDGLWGNGSVSHTATDDPTPWWEVALAVEGTIEEIVLWNRVDCCWDRLTNFRVSVLDCDRGEVWSELFFEDGLGYPAPGEPFEIPLLAGTRGKFVRVALHGPFPGRETQFYLQLAEVEVLGDAPDPPPDPNLARKGKASQSSQLGAYAADLAIDGDYGNFTHTQTGVNTPATWELDLGEMVEIGFIVLHNRVDCCGSRLRDIIISIFDDARDLIFDSDLLNPENELGSYPFGPATLEFDLVAESGGPVKGRTIQVQRIPDPDLSGSAGQGNPDEADVLSLAEVEVFPPAACPAQGDTHCKGISLVGPGENKPGRYTLKAGAHDEDCDVIRYTFVADNGIDPPTIVGPLPVNETSVLLGIGSWTISVSVDDETRCPDLAPDATCTEEVELAPHPDNVAVFGIATQSSTGYGGLPERAIDGIVSGVYGDGSVSHTGDNDPAPWWEVDLGEIFPLDRIVIWNRTDVCCLARLSNFRVSVLDDLRDIVFEEDFFTDGTGYPDTREEGFEIPLPAGIEGQIVRVELLGPNATGTMFIHMAEVEVYRVSGPLQPLFRRGYVNSDRTLDLGDAIFILNYMFAGGTAPTCVKAADIDDNGALTIGDAINLLNYQFAGGPPPAAPFAACGADPTPDPLTCVASPVCAP